MKASGLLSKTFPEIVGTSGGTFEQTDLSVPTEPEWFSRGVERDADLPFSDFDSGRGIFPRDWVNVRKSGIYLNWNSSW